MIGLSKLPLLIDGQSVDIRRSIFCQIYPTGDILSSTMLTNDINMFQLMHGLRRKH